jgi:YfiH family protein
MERSEREGLQYYINPRWQEIRHGVFTRHGGVSSDPWGTLNTGGTVGDDVEAVRENHRRIFAALDVNGERSCTTWQVHGVDVVHANEPVQGRRWVARADGIITNQPDVPLVMRYADCVPLLVYDPVVKAIGLGHAGWRGTVKGMAANMVRAMQQAYGSKPADIQAVIGPSISPERYQVGEEVVAAAHDYYGESADIIRRDPADGTAYLDLWTANMLDFQQVGVTDLEVMGICTYQNTTDFHSHRAEKGRTGRFGVVMSL